MTVLKTTAVKTASMLGLQKYLERDGKCVRVGTLNVVDERHWAQEMDEHARLERVSERTAKRGLHFILAFSLDDISPLSRDGVLNEEAVDFADGYVREFVEAEFPGLQVAWAVHVERCERDGTSRLATHVVAGRVVITDFVYPDGSGRVARAGTLYDRRRSVQREQVERVRRMDRAAGFREVRRGRNSTTHFIRDPSRSELNMRSRGETPRKEELARRVLEAAERPGVADMESLKAELEGEGYHLDIVRTRANATLTDREGGRRYRLSTLGIDRAELERQIAARAAAAEAAHRVVATRECVHRFPEDSVRVAEAEMRASERSARCVSGRESAAVSIAARVAEALALLASKAFAVLQVALRAARGNEIVHVGWPRGDRGRER